LRTALLLLLPSPALSFCWIAAPTIGVVPRSRRSWQRTTLRAASSPSLPLLEEEQQEQPSVVQDDNNVNKQQPQQEQDSQVVRGGALSRTASELAEALGGAVGRARLAWDCYRIGVDPAVLFGGADNKTATNLDWEDDETEIIRAQLPGKRRKQVLGKEALQSLAQLHSTHCHGVDRVDGGVAQLVFTNTAEDGTTKALLRLHDGVEIEMVIIPWYNTGRSTLCISSQVGCRQGVLAV